MAFRSSAALFEEGEAAAAPDVVGGASVGETDEFSAPVAGAAVAGGEALVAVTDDVGASPAPVGTDVDVPGLETAS